MFFTMLVTSPSTRLLSGSRVVSFIWNLGNFFLYFDHNFVRCFPSNKTSNKLLDFFSEVALVEFHLDDALWTSYSCHDLERINSNNNHYKSTTTTKTTKATKARTTTTTITNQQQQQKQPQQREQQQQQRQQRQQRRQRQGEQQQQQQHQHIMIAHLSREKNGSKSFQYGAKKESIGYCDRAGAHLKREKSLKLKLVQTKRFVLLISRYLESFAHRSSPRVSRVICSNLSLKRFWGGFLRWY